MTKPLNYDFTQVAAPDDQPPSSAEKKDLPPGKGEMLINPRYHFHRPLAVLHSDVLDRQEKIDVLREWAADLREESQEVSRTFQSNQLAGSGELEEIRDALHQLGTRRQAAA